MGNLENIWEVLERSPVLYYESRTQMHSPELNEDVEGSINGRYLVDYEHKRAVVFHQVEQGEAKNVVTTLYENGKIHRYYHGLAADEEQQLTSEQYDALFENGGELFPVDQAAFVSAEEAETVSESAGLVQGICQMPNDNELCFAVENEHCSISLTIKILISR